MSWTGTGRPRRRGFRPSPEGLEERGLLTTLPAGFVETTVATGLTEPTTFDFAPDGRIFVAQQTGQLRVIKDGQLLPTPFLSLNVDSSGERGLLGVAFDPQFATDHFVYVYYTVPGAPAHNRVSRFTAAGDVAVLGSEVPILDLNPLGAVLHNGGAIHFGPDGKLYVGVGENTVGANAQSLDNLLGKILRINPDGSIPPDNPFFNIATGQNRAIWALGLRNPFTFAFQPGTGRLFINDVGQNTWEEIDDGVAGANYGWPVTEGPTTDPRFRGPFYAYQHGPNDVFGQAITGGTFYDPATPEFPADLVGSYFFADLGGDWIHRLDPRTGAESDFATNLPPAPVDLAVSPGGSLYYLARGSGTNTGVLARIDFVPTPTPTPTPTPSPSPTPTPTPVPAPTLALVGVRRLPPAGRLRNPPAQFALTFNLPLDAAVASNVGIYQVTQPGPFRRSRPVRVAVRAARYDAATNTVTLTLGRILPRRPLSLVITGLRSPGASAGPIATTL